MLSKERIRASPFGHCLDVKSRKIGDSMGVDSALIDELGDEVVVQL
jgi:hypothetical protein